MMNPSGVRRVVLADHAKLRKLMPGVYRAIAALGVEGSIIAERPRRTPARP